MRAAYRRTTPIERHLYDHPAGMPSMEQYEVVTDLPSLAECPYEELSADEREWWDDICDRHHAADVDYEQLSVDEQERVTELLGDAGDLDLDSYVEQYERAVAEVTKG